MVPSYNELANSHLPLALSGVLRSTIRHQQRVSPEPDSGDYLRLLIQQTEAATEVQAESLFACSDLQMCEKPGLTKLPRIAVLVVKQTVRLLAVYKSLGHSVPFQPLT